MPKEINTDEFRSPKALRAAERRATSFAGAERRTPGEIRRVARDVLEAEPALAVDYLVLVDPATFTEVGDDHRGEAVLAVAGRVGSTRLIDNVTVTL